MTSPISRGLLCPGPTGRDSDLRVEVLTESAPKSIRLTREQADALTVAGTQLAGDASWWGESEDEPARSVIDCIPSSDGAWVVRVADAIGVVVVGDVQLVVQPKIPMGHLLYLLEEGGYVPRVREELAAVDLGTSLWRLVARWFVRATEGVLRRDLLRDYHPEAGELPAARGQVVALQTARAYYAGRLAFDCRYEEFGHDTPLNRVLKRAAQVVAGSPVLDPPLRRRAVGLLARMEAVGPMRLRDSNAHLERNSGYYSPAIAWARHVIKARGRAPMAGSSHAWTFLIRTPEPVEDGIRVLLQRRLPGVSVAKRGRRLEGSHLTINPDLVLEDDVAVADVKYKVSGGEWSRPELYQLVTFATGFQSPHAALVSFAPPGQAPLPSLKVGDVSVEHLPWPGNRSIRAEEASRKFTDGFGAWLQRITPQPLIATSAGT